MRDSIQVQATMVAFEHMMLSEARRTEPERRPLVVAWRRLMPDRFRVYTDGSSAEVYDFWEGQVYRGAGEGVAEKARAYAKARNDAWRADVRFEMEEDRP